jgi:CHAD domain-containing protein
MAWRFEPGEELAAAFRRVAIEELGRVRADLNSGQDDRDAAVHGARQGFKRLRALLRLARPALGSSYADENRRWRDAGRDLAGFRDGAVVRQTFDSAAAGAGPKLAGMEADSLRASVMAGEEAPDIKDVEKALRATRAGLLSARRRMDEVIWPQTVEDLRIGLKTSQVRLRKSWRAARADPTAEAMHGWRKRVKDQSAQLRLLRGVAPEEMRKRRETLKKIAELLGEEHDLCSLVERLTDGEPPADAEKGQAVLLRAIAKRRKLLRRKAFKAANGVCDEKPGAFASALVDAWERKARPSRQQAEKGS